MPRLTNTNAKEEQDGGKPCRLKGSSEDQLLKHVQDLTGAFRDALK